jgi:hypothetical protein
MVIDELVISSIKGRNRKAKNTLKSIAADG